MQSPGGNLGDSPTRVYDAGCFAISYAREANAWSAYNYESNTGQTVSDNAPIWDNFVEATITPDQNFGDAEGIGYNDDIYASVRSDHFEAATGKASSELPVISGDKEIKGILTGILNSENPYTVIGTIPYGSGKHAFNINGFDPETGMVTGFDSSVNSHGVEQIHYTELLEVRPMTFGEEE